MAEYVRKKPFFIAVAMAVFGFIGSLGGLVVIFGLFRILSSEGPFSLNGEAVSKSEFLGFAVPFLLLNLVGCILLVGIAWLIHSERAIARPLLLASLTVPLLALLGSPLYGIPLGDVGLSIAWWVLIVLGTWSYLYQMPSCSEYYSALSAEVSGRP